MTQKKVIAIIQARVRSERLYGKILKPLSEREQLLHVVDRVRAATTPELVIVATSANEADDATEALCDKEGITVVRGQEDDVLDRVYLAAKPHTPDIVVRITADCPLVIPEGIDEVVTTLQQQKLDYCIWDLERIPLGLASEAIRFDALETAWKKTTPSNDPVAREHVTWYVHSQPDTFKVLKMATQLAPNRPDLRLTVDTAEDFEVLSKIYDALWKPSSVIDVDAVIRYLDENPEIAAINKTVRQKPVPKYLQ